MFSGARAATPKHLLHVWGNIKAADVLFEALAANPKHPLHAGSRGENQSSRRALCGLGSKAKASVARWDSRGKSKQQTRFLRPGQQSQSIRCTLGVAGKINATDVFFGALAAKPKHPLHAGSRGETSKQQTWFLELWQQSQSILRTFRVAKQNQSSRRALWALAAKPKHPSHVWRFLHAGGPL